MSADYVIPAAPQATIAVAGTTKTYPVRRIWCVGRNYIEHIREMGQDERLPPFYFAKAADMIVPDGGTVPYPTLTKDMHHEVELVVAEIRQRAANKLPWGAQKVIAYDLGLTTSYVNQVLRNYRRKTT